MKIAVLGGGHGSYAAAADLSEQGHEVRFWRRDHEAFAPVLQSRVIVLKDERGSRPVSIPRPTTDLSVALAGAELILIPTPATAQADLARAMAPYLEDGQVVYLPPGTFGSIVMDRIARAAGSTAEVTYAETGTLPWLTRKHGAADVAITVRAVRLPTGCYPARRTAHALPLIARAFAAAQGCEDVLSAALLNGGPMIHPPLIVLNAAPLQHFASWDIHNEGTQPAVRRVTDALDAERIAAREALGYTAPHFPISDHNLSDRWMYGDAHKRLTDSGDWREKIDLETHRYMLEDVAMGLSFVCSAARYAGTDARVADGLLALCGAILGRDLRLGERSLETLDLATYSREALKHGLVEGGL